MKGILWAIIAVLALLVAQLFGKAGKTKAKAAEQKAEVAEKEKDIAQAVTPIIVEAVKKQTQAETEYEQTMENIDKAKNSNDIDLLYKLAEKAAQKALSLGAKEKEE